MTPHQVLAVSVRLFAIWLLLFYVADTMNIYVNVSKLSNDKTLLPLLIGFGSTALICTLLWIFPSAIARKLLPNTSGIYEPKNNAFDTWFSVGCSLIGIWVIARAVPALVSYFSSDLLGKKFRPESYIENPDWTLLVSFNLFQLAFGLLLFLGGNGIKKIILWAKHA